MRKNSKNRTFKQFIVANGYSVRGHRNRCTSHFRVRKKYSFAVSRTGGIITANPARTEVMNSLKSEPPHLPVFLQWRTVGEKMFHYPFHVGDYIADTAHLSIEEDIAYRRLLDLYYTSEKPLPNDGKQVARRIRMGQHETLIDAILQEFFTLQDDGCWHHSRCDDEIAKYQGFIEAGKRGAAKRWSKGADSLPISGGNSNQEPRTKNQEPIVKVNRGSRLQPDLPLPGLWFRFCKDERPELDPLKTFEKFKDYWIAQPGQKGVKLDWDATWRNWVRSTTAPKLNPADIVRLTVPSKNEPDPALEKIKADERTTRPPTLAELAKMAELRRKA